LAFLPADVSAKESCQETAVTLLGIVGGLVFASHIAEHAAVAWQVFTALTLLHVYANYQGTMPAAPCPLVFMGGNSESPVS
jgi:hypothetical protein